ncbi:MAG TPA: transcriptional regulator, TraR/DksA family protein [Nitrospirae bacterium]|nr:transcriptional regulator, TraR/DksA family protein [Nitrospirota bacterium]
METQKKSKIRENKKSSQTPVNNTISREERLRKILIEKKDILVKEASKEIKKFQSGENKQIIETVRDDGDLSVVDLSEDISLKQLSSHRETLIKIDTALQKIDEGTYGICEECNEEISEKRLAIMPFAIYCKDCQEQKEIMAKMEQFVEQQQ